MIAFDTNVLTGILLGDEVFLAKALTIPTHEQSVPVIVIEEIIRGRLTIIFLCFLSKQPRQTRIALNVIFAENGSISSQAIIIITPVCITTRLTVKMKLSQ